MTSVTATVASMSVAVAVPGWEHRRASRRRRQSADTRRSRE